MSSYSFQTSRCVYCHFVPARTPLGSCLGPISCLVCLASNHWFCKLDCRKVHKILRPPDQKRHGHVTMPLLLRETTALMQKLANCSSEPDWSHRLQHGNSALGVLPCRCCTCTGTRSATSLSASSLRSSQSYVSSRYMAALCQRSRTIRCRYVHIFPRCGRGVDRVAIGTENFSNLLATMLVRVPLN